jgi:hypothetical protein
MMCLNFFQKIDILIKRMEREQKYTYRQSSRDRQLYTVRRVACIQQACMLIKQLYWYRQAIVSCMPYSRHAIRQEAVRMHAHCALR